MSETEDKETIGEKRKSRNNAVTIVACVFLVCAMTGLSFAAVPLYRIFCQVTGYGGTTQRADLTDDIKQIDRVMTVRFDANTANGLKWTFKPLQRSIKIHLGEKSTAYYVAENTSDQTITGTASFNVTPQGAGVYFNKIECFCFTETTLKPGEKIEMPVVFFIDPDLDKDPNLDRFNTITLSYTMYPDETADNGDKQALLEGAGKESSEGTQTPVMTR